MTSAKKIYLAVAGGLVAAGVVLASIGFIASGFDPAVFTTQIDMRDSTIVLGGVEVDDSFIPRATLGLSVFWTTPIGPLRFNFARAIDKQSYDKEQFFDLTISTKF